ncbi:MAG: hypothetical protein NTZ61_03670, partial [Proteobacteria bacterium]|nr:hypothetical protein [Pseudomonadota bacterium]
MSVRISGRFSLLPFALLLPIACATPDNGPMTGKDLAGAVLGGYSIGGINLGAAVGVAKGANEAYREIPVDEEVAIGRSVSAGLLGAAP